MRLGTCCQCRSSDSSPIQLQTCFDVRFVEDSNELTRLGATALTYPSAFAVNTGAAHWEILLRARAIENQCYVFGSAQAYVARVSYSRRAFPLV